MSRLPRRLRAVLAALLAAGLVLPAVVPPGPASAQDEYRMATRATYTVAPVDREVAVAVEVDFTNTTPDPAGQFSVFEEVKLAIHDGATAVAAEDDDGALSVDVARENDVNVATVELRDAVRFDDTASFTLEYLLEDGEAAEVRIRSAVASFPVWGFGTSSEVGVLLPAGYEVGVDGDSLSATTTTGGVELRSGAIGDPQRWLAVITATRPTDYLTLSERVPLAGGTADLQVRAWEDDEAWGERVLALLTRALPLFEEEIGLPYPRVAPLVVTEAVGGSGHDFDEAPAGGTEILIAFDQPEFTTLHQVAHAWLNDSLLAERWLQEGLASYVAERVGSRLEVEPPFDPQARTDELADAALPLDSWATAGDDEADDYGYAASWATVDDIAVLVGHDTLHRVVARAAAGVDGYEPARPEGRTPDGQPLPLTSRGFLDHLETLADGADLDTIFAERVLSEPDAGLLDERATAREAYADLLAAAGDWGAPDPVHRAMVEWRFADAQPEIAAARRWLGERDDLLGELEAAGLSAPERLRARYRESGGGPEAEAELDAHRAVVRAYRDTLAEVNAERSITERLGLLGGPDPASLLTAANGAYAEGDLIGAADHIANAQRTLESARTGGLVRIASAVVVLLLLAAAAYLVMRRRGRHPTVG